MDAVGARDRCTSHSAGRGYSSPLHGLGEPETHPILRGAMRNSAAAIMAHDQLGDDEDPTFVCVECIGDEYLRNEVHEVGKSGTCTYCESDENNVISLEDLADRNHEVLEAQYYMTSSEPEGFDYYLAKEGKWEQPGDPVAVIIADIAGLEEQIAEDIRDHLSGISRLLLSQGRR